MPKTGPVNSWGNNRINLICGDNHELKYLDAFIIGGIQARLNPDFQMMSTIDTFFFATCCPLTFFRIVHL